MKVVKKFGMFTLVILSFLACKNSSQSRKIDNETNSYNSITKTEEVISNDSIKNDYKTKSYDYIEETNDWYNDANGNSKRLKLVKTDGKIGFLYETGEELFPCTFDSVVDVKNSGYSIVNGKYLPTQKGYFTHSYNNKRYAKVEKEGKWGLISIDGKVAMPFINDEIYDFDYAKTSRMEGPYLDFWDYNGKLAVIKKNGKWGLVNTKGEVLADFIYDKFFIPDVHLFYGNRAAAKKDGKWGFINEKGKPIGSFNYDSVGSTYLKNSKFISSFNEGMAVVKKEGKWGAIDSDGKEKIPFIYDYISSFIRESAIARKNDKWGYINKRGAEVIPIKYDEIKWFEMGLCPAKKDGLWGFLNEKGEVVVPTMYDDILISEEVSVDGGLWFFSQDGFCAVKKNGKWGLIDKDNSTVAPFEYDEIKFTSSGLDDWRFFSDGLLKVQKGDFWSVINKNGLNHIPFEYDDVAIWSEGNVCVKKHNMWGLLDSLGRQLIPIEHKNAMEAGNFRYKTNSK